MFNNDAPETSNNYSLVVTKRNGYNVETLGDASATSSLELSSQTHFFSHKGKRSSPFSSAGDTYAQLSSNQNRATQNKRTLMLRSTRLAAGICLSCLHVCVTLAPVQCDHIWNLSFETVSKRSAV